MDAEEGSGRNVGELFPVMRLLPRFPFKGSRVDRGENLTGEGGGRCRGGRGQERNPEVVDRGW